MKTIHTFLSLKLLLASLWAAVLLGLLCLRQRPSLAAFSSEEGVKGLFPNLLYHLGHGLGVLLELWVLGILCQRRPQFLSYIEVA